MFTSLDLERSYTYLFEQMWYSQLPCFDVLNITTKEYQNHSKYRRKTCILYLLISKNNDNSGLLKKCLWRGRPLSCASIFKMQPTDQGMCCSFNKQKAKEMYVEGRYQEHVTKMTHQDAMQARSGSRLPEW